MNTEEYITKKYSSITLKEKNSRFIDGIRTLFRDWTEVLVRKILKT
jgi:hypothetical protein